jgi:glutamate synthase domain-containing protein 3
MESLNCESLGTRSVNQRLRSLPDGGHARLVHPRGRHNLAVGLTSRISIDIAGNAGYFVGGLGGNRDGIVGWAVGENLMGGSVRVRGSASQSAGSSARGGTIVIEGDASLRAGISLKGATLAIGGNAGAMSGFMAQSGVILIGGNAGHGLGDSLYEAIIYVAGSIDSLGSDAVITEMSDEDLLTVKELVSETGLDHIDPTRVTKVTSARRLYHFSTHNHGAY